MSDPQPFPADSPLIGSWRMQKSGDATLLHIGNQGPTGRIINVEFSSNGKIKAESYVVIPSELNGVNYLSIRMPEKPTPRFALLKYKISNGNHLSMWSADRAFVKNAVQQGLLKGKINDKTLASSVLILAEQRALQGFVIQHEAQLFNGEAEEFDKV